MIRTKVSGLINFLLTSHVYQEEDDIQLIYQHVYSISLEASIYKHIFLQSVLLSNILTMLGINKKSQMDVVMVFIMFAFRLMGKECIYHTTENHKLSCPG